MVIIFYFVEKSENIYFLRRQIYYKIKSLKILHYVY